MIEQTILRFESDYMEGTHPSILEKLLETNMEQTSGYGLDPYCESAKDKIRLACACPEAEVYFLVGGTQTNATIIDAVLASYQGVLAADTGHISVHESGAIEASGHKVLTLQHKDGKLAGKDVEEYLERFYADSSNEHMVAPGMVYISHPTEFGTLYTASELKNLHEICLRYHIPLFLDGARLGYGLMAEQTDVTLPLIAKYCDIFYIGGTKVGAMFGEAVVFTSPNLVKHFFTMIKQHGALLAKGRLLGIQFDTLFTNNLYFDIAKHAINMAQLLKNAFQEKGYRFYIDSPTNQIFIVLDNQKMKLLSEKVSFSFWEKVDCEHTVVRFATSWATQGDAVSALIQLL